MKKHPKKAWEEQIKDRLSNLEASPDDTLWANIEHNIQPNRYRYAPVAAVLLFLLCSGGWLLHYNFKQDPVDQLSSGREVVKENSRNEVETHPSPGTGFMGSGEKLDEKKATPYKDYKKEGVLIMEGEEKKGSTARKSVVEHDSANPSQKKISSGQMLMEEEKEENEHRDFAISTNKFSPFVKIKGKKPLFSSQFQLLKDLPFWRLENNPDEEKEIVKPSLKDSRFEIWGSFNPMLTYRKVVPNMKDDIKIIEMEDQSPLSLDRIGLQTSVGASYFITDRLALKGGAFYRFTRNKWSYSYLTGTADSVLFTPLEGGAVEVEPVFTELVEKIESKNAEIGLLVGLQYSAGEMYRRNINLEVQAARDPERNKMLYYLAFDVDVEKNIGKNFLVYAGPSFMWGLNGSASSAYETFELKPYSIGLKIGVSYRVKMK